MEKIVKEDPDSQHNIKIQKEETPSVYVAENTADATRFIHKGTTVKCGQKPTIKDYI